MHSIDVLLTLVHSLTKSEKRYFRLQADLQQGEKGYLLLFDFLERNQTLDEKAMAKLRGLFAGTSVEPARKHLYRVLMKSLRQFESEKDLDTRLMNLLHESRILYNKGLIAASLEQLDKVKRLALAGEKSLHYVLAGRQELQYLKRSHFAKLGEYQLLEKHEKIKAMLERESKETQYASLYEILLLRYWRNGTARTQQDVTQLNDLLLEEYQLLQARGEKTFEWQQLQLHFQSTYFQMSGNPAGSLNVFYELNKLFEANEPLWRDSPLSYFHLLDGILSELRWMERYSDMDFFLAQMKKIPRLAENLDALIAARTLAHDLNRLVDQRKHTEAHAKLKDPGAPGRDVAALPVQVKGELVFSMIRAYTGAQDYAMALRLINANLNQPASSISPTLYFRFQLMNLLVNAALGHHDYLPYAVRSMERKLKNEQRFHGTERLILALLKKYSTKNKFTGWEEELATLSENPFERQLIKDLCLDEWLVKMKLRKPVV